MPDYGLQRNSEGYKDPTAYQAMSNIIREENERQRRVSALVSAIKVIVNLAGYDLINRIELRDRKTGQEYR